MRSTRTALVAALIGAASLAGCGSPGPQPAAAPTPVAAPAVSSARASSAAPGSRNALPPPPADGAPARDPSSPDDVSYRCTNRFDYSSDSRDNATINSIGADTGRCPPLVHG